MAQFTKRRIVLTLVWDKRDPDDIRWEASCRAALPDDSKDTGEEVVNVATGDQTITRAQFRSITGQQIEDTVVAAIDAAIQDLGTGAGGHTIIDDTGT